MRLALVCIVKDEVEQVKRIVNEYQEFFDELVFGVDDYKTYYELISELKDNLKVSIHKYDWIGDFAHKRNWLAGKVKSDYYMRIDTDDVIDKPHLIPQAFKAYVRNGYTLILFRYLYGFDASGVCNAMHWRETIIKNDGNIFWNKPIHENTNPKVSRKMQVGKETMIQVIHNASPEERIASADRNFKVLLEEYEQRKKDAKKQDARTVGYIARMYLGKQEYRKAISFFWEFLSTSGWDDDKYFAWIQLADCYISLGDLEQGLTCCVEALLLNPNYPDVYFHMMLIYYNRREYKKAIFWGEQGFSKPEPETMYVLDPSAYTWRPAAQIAMCYMHVGQFQKAIAMLEKAHKIAPKEDEIIKILREFGSIYRDNEAVKNYLRLMDYTRNDLRLFKLLVQSIPPKLANDERICATRTMIEPPKVWAKDSIVFYCGQAWEDWVDVSVVSGIGGSEEATIYLARQFAQCGYKVTVFNQCGELEGEYKGVRYLNYYKFNPRDTFNILISWRNNIFAKAPVKARKKLLWLHDIPTPDMIIDEDLDNIDHIIVLSQFHKNYLKHLKDQLKIYVSRNGIDLSSIDKIELKNDPKKMIYASSYDRGLEQLLIRWDRVHKAVPDAELHIYYGWNTYLEMLRVGRRSRQFYDKMCLLMKQPNVYEHGRVGQKKLVSAYARSGLWVYPCTFEEISCIGAMRAQVLGATPFCTGYAALKETVRFGAKIKGDINNPATFDTFVNLLIFKLKNPDSDTTRLQMIEKSKKLFSWKGVAKNWQRNLF